PWIEKGYVTRHDIRDQERFDGYYNNKFLIVNDCLQKYRFLAKWMFFFDEMSSYLCLKRVLSSLWLIRYQIITQFTTERMSMSNKICLEEVHDKCF
uniref:Glycosyltransferase family 92 protein n=1 Tax=Solanum lycopersicum TaxID=4081 RepID=A0A3Q7HAD1_SOLLC